MNVNTQNTYQDSDYIFSIFDESLKTQFKEGNTICVNSTEKICLIKIFNNVNNINAREFKDEIEPFICTSEFFPKLLVIPYTMLGIWQRKYNNKKERKNKYENVPKKETKNSNSIIRNKRKFYRKFKK